MNLDNLLSKMGLNDRPKVAKREQEEPNPQSLTAQQHGIRAEASSDTVLELNEWDLAKGAELAARSRLPDPQKQLTPNAMADFYGACFKPEPILHESCIDKRRHEFLSTLIQTVEYQTLHRDTQLDVLGAKLAATKLASQYATLVQKDAKEEGKAQPTTEKQRKKAERKAEMRCLLAARQALEQAQEEIDQLKDTMEALGAGKGEGQKQALDVEKIAQTFQRVRDSEKLRRIINSAGRMRPYMQGKQRQKANYGYSDMIGIKLDDNIEKLLDEELAAICDDDLCDETYARLVEREALCYDYREIEKLGKGPIVALCDVSGSMGGKKEEDAKAFCLTMAWLGNWQKRWVILATFADDSYTNILALRPGKWDQAKLLSWLEYFTGGGTSCDVPLIDMPNIHWPNFRKEGMPKGKADMCIITDGMLHTPPEVEKAFLEWKKAEKVRVISLIIGCWSAGGLAGVSDEVHLMNGINTGEKGVESCFSI